MTPEKVLKQLKWRYAVKKFDASKKIPDSVRQVLEQSLVLSPSSFGLQPQKFYVVRNPELRQQLLPHSWGQEQVVDASHLVVLAIKKDVDEAEVDLYVNTVRDAPQPGASLTVNRMAQVQQVPVEKLEKFGEMVKGFLKDPPFPFEVNSWSARQVYIALGFLMTCAAMLEIDTCPMEGFVPSEYDRILGLPAKGYHSVVICPLGYRAEDDKAADRPKVRFPTEVVVEYVD